MARTHNRNELPDGGGGIGQSSMPAPPGLIDWAPDNQEDLCSAILVLSSHQSGMKIWRRCQNMHYQGRLVCYPMKQLGTAHIHIQSFECVRRAGGIIMRKGGRSFKEKKGARNLMKASKNKLVKLHLMRMPTLWRAIYCFTLTQEMTLCHR